MPTSLRDLLSLHDLQLRLVAGGDGAGRPIRWAHVSELEDPTPFLRGGEVLLTTGLGIGTGDRAARFVGRLAAAGLAGLGLGLGFGFESVPPAMRAAADRHAFPVFEVPFDVPFIAITEALFSRLVNEQLLLLQRAGTVQQTLARLLLDEAGLEQLLGAYARMTASHAMLLDLRGEVVAASPGAAERLDPVAVWLEIESMRPEHGEFAVSLSGPGRSTAVLPVSLAGRTTAFLVLGRDERPEPFHQVVAHHIVTAIALELAKERAVAATERRLVGDFLDALQDGELSDAELGRRLRFLGLDPASGLAVLLLRPEPRDAATAGRELESLHQLVDAQLSRRGVRAASTIGSGLVAVVFQAPWTGTARTLAEDLARAVRLREGGTIACGLGGPVTAGRDVRRAYAEAGFALRAGGSDVATAGVAGVEDLGSHMLLFALGNDAALRAFTAALLGPVHAYDQRTGDARGAAGGLTGSLQAFLEHNGNWEPASRALGVHRHTLRYRMRRIEELTGRDLTLAGDRVEFWLALQAEQILRGEAPVDVR